VQFRHKYENWSTARVWLARENVLSGCYARTASRWRQSASLRQSIRKVRTDSPAIRGGRSRRGLAQVSDLDRWIGVNIRRIRQLELDVARPKRILDLGCGAGYFLYIAQLLGHSGVGLDIDRLAMFREITRLLGVRRVVQQIEAFRPLPSSDKNSTSLPLS
jgi:Ribosomal protein L11 methylase